MDAKSLAKSKRAHTQHHNKKSHSVHKLKSHGVSDNNNNTRDTVKPQGNQTGALNTKSPVQSRRVSALPSNWDRYNDEIDSGLDIASGGLSTSRPEDVTVPKSKGADYMHLLSEAQAESQSKIEIVPDCLSSLDDLLHDEFSRVVGSMISARGEGIISWMEDDNFVVEEDGSASNHELGFLSLDLNALEKTLEKVDLHERIYIDADLLPLDLCTTQSILSRDKEPCHPHTTENAEAVTKSLDEPPVQQESSVLDHESLDQTKEIPILKDQSEKSSATELDLDLLLDSFSEQHTQLNPIASGSSTSNQNPPVQRSSAFESELDSLLNSHSGTESFNKPANISDQTLGTSSSTSVPIKPPQNQTSSSSSVRKSQVLDEFDSWLDTI
ncbi:unnamed protein product [Cochlearia groenlandica]